MIAVASLDARILDAHGRGDAAALAALYAEAAEGAEDGDARAFFLTHALVWALDAGASEAPAIQAELARLGRDEVPEGRTSAPRQPRADASISARIVASS